MKPFILNDENVKNSYGFFVRNKGGRFDRFLKNPTMLHNHDSNQHTGDWENFRVEDPLILAEPKFMSTPFANEIKKSVEDGFLRGASMGLLIESSTAFEKQPNGDWWLIDWELAEASTCPVPSNAGALRLFDRHSGKELKSEQIALCLSQLEQDFQLNNDPPMKEVKLSTAALTALALDQQPETEQELNAAIVSLSKKLTDEKNAHQQTKTELSEISKTQAKELVKQAKLAGKITEAEVPEWEKMAESNLVLASTALGKIPAKQNLHTGGVPPVGGTDELPKTPDEFEKLSAQQKADFKANHPDEYKALWVKK